jgi:hypothetical protein
MHSFIGAISPSRKLTSTGCEKNQMHTQEDGAEPFDHGD